MKRMVHSGTLGSCHFKTITVPEAFQQFWSKIKHFVQVTTPEFWSKDQTFSFRLTTPECVILKPMLSFVQINLTIYSKGMAMRPYFNHQE